MWKQRSGTLGRDVGEEEPAPGAASVALVEDTIISLPEGIALQEADVQLLPDPRDEFQSQITEEEAFCGGLNTCPQIPCGLPLNLGGLPALGERGHTACLLTLGASGCPLFLFFFLLYHLHRVSVRGTT